MDEQQVMNELLDAVRDLITVGATPFVIAQYMALSTRYGASDVQVRGAVDAGLAIIYRRIDEAFLSCH